MLHKIYYLTSLTLLLARSKLSFGPTPDDLMSYVVLAKSHFNLGRVCILSLSWACILSLSPGRCVCWSVGQSVGVSVGLSVFRSDGSVSRSVSVSVGRSVGRSFGQ